MYQQIWLTIKANGPRKELAVRTHAEATKRLIQAVRKEKAMDVGIRRKVGMLVEGPLLVEVVQDPTDKRFVLIKFKLSWSERLKDI